MPSVRDAAGVIHNFPDSATPEMISEALGLGGGAPGAPGQEVRAAPPQDTSFLRYPRMGFQAAETGLAKAAGLPGDLQSLGNAGVNYLLPERMRGPPGFSLPTGSDVVDYLGRHGIGRTADVLPSGPGERAFSGGIEGGAAAAPLLLAGPEAGIIPGLVGGTTGGAVEGLTGSPAAGAAAGVISGLAGTGISSLLSGGLERIASRLGGSETLQQAGEALQDSAREWKRTVMPAAEAAVWGPVDAAIPPHTPTFLTNYGQALQDLTTRAPSQAATAAVLTPATTRRLSSALTSTYASWEDARAIRSMLGEAMSNPKLFPDLGPKQISTLYRAVTEDLHDAALGVGADDLFNAANAESARLHAIGEGPMSRLVTGISREVTDRPPEAVASSLLSAGRRGGSDLGVLREAIPDAVDELAAAHLRVNSRGWSGLAPEAQQALIPEDWMRQRVSRAIPGPPPRIGSHSLQALVGGTAAHSAGMLLGHFFPETQGTNPLITGAASELMGLAAPSAWRGARALVYNPGLAVAPAVGGYGGGNTLVPPGAEALPGRTP